MGVNVLNGMPARYLASNPTLTNGQPSALRVNVNGLLLTSSTISAGASIGVTDGTNSLNILKSDGTAAGQNAALVAGTYLSVPFTTTTAQAVGTTDAGNYKTVAVHITSQGGSSTINFQGSNDNTNWVAVGLTSAASAATEVNGTTSASLIYHGGLPYRYFRLNVTGIASGTTAGTIVFSTLPFPARGGTMLAAQNGTWTVQPGNTQNTTAWKMEQQFSYGRATADTQIKGSAGFIHTINIAPTGTVTAGVLTVYDSTSETGTVIYSVSLPVTSFTPFSVPLNVIAGTGIYVGFDATLANVQATVSFR